MPFTYDVPQNPGPLVQGEILAGIYELRPMHPPTRVPEEQPIPVQPVAHPQMIVMTAVCDLEQDFNMRFPDAHGSHSYQPATIDEGDPNLVPHILLCEVYSYDDIRPRFPGMKDVWKRVQKNQDERYHHFEAAPVGEPSMNQLSDLYLDFRKTLALPTGTVYEGLGSGKIERLAVVPPVFVHDLIHRFYGYLSRVGVPT